MRIGRNFENIFFGMIFFCLKKENKIVFTARRSPSDRISDRLGSDSDSAESEILKRSNPREIGRIAYPLGIKSANLKMQSRFLANAHIRSSWIELRNQKLGVEGTVTEI